MFQLSYFRFYIPMMTALKALELIDKNQDDSLSVSYSQMMLYHFVFHNDDGYMMIMIMMIGIRLSLSSVDLNEAVVDLGGPQ